MIHLGFERGTGDDVEIPVMHTLTTGITRHGKSETMQAMAERAVSAGYTVLLFDVKAKRDYADVGQEIPIYLEEATDPTTLKGLLETSAKMSLAFQYSELIKVYEPGDDYQAVLDRMETIKNDPDTHPVEEDKLRVLHHLLEDLVRELDGIAISDDLELVEPGINVMNLSDVDGPIQQLAIASTVEAVLEDREDVILGVDEAHNFIPQKGQPPAHQPLVKAIREGAASNIWIYLSDQTITGVDKDPLKQVGVWLLGKQREKNEAQRVLDQIPGRSEFTSEDVMTLSKGNFIVALDDATPLAYVQPVWMDEAEARAIASGEATMDDIQEPDTEDVQEIEEELAEREARIKNLESELESRDEQIADLEGQVDRLNELLEQHDSQPSTGSEGEPDVLIPREQVVEVVEDYIEELEAPESVTVEATRSKLHVKRVVEPIEVTTDDRLGKVAYLYAKGEFPDGEWFTTGDTEEILVSHGWNETVKRTDVLNRMAQMGFLEQQVRADRTREYRVDMPASEAQDEGLLEIETELTQ